MLPEFLQNRDPLMPREELAFVVRELLLPPGPWAKKDPPKRGQPRPVVHHRTHVSERDRSHGVPEPLTINVNFECWPRVIDGVEREGWVFTGPVLFTDQDAYIAHGRENAQAFLKEQSSATELAITRVEGDVVWIEAFFADPALKDTRWM